MKYTVEKSFQIKNEFKNERLEIASHGIYSDTMIEIRKFDQFNNRTSPAEKLSIEIDMIPVLIQILQRYNSKEEVSCTNT